MHVIFATIHKSLPGLEQFTSPAPSLLSRTWGGLWVKVQKGVFHVGAFPMQFAQPLQELDAFCVGLGIEIPHQKLRHTLPALWGGGRGEGKGGEGSIALMKQKSQTIFSSEVIKFDVLTL
jgi:hypothetical protein